MLKRAVSTIMLTLILTSMLTLAFSAHATGGCGRPVLTVPVIISSESSEVGYIVGATLNAGFTIRNDGDAAIRLDKLGVGGRFNGGTGTLPNGLFPDFTFQTVTLQPGESHQYSGRLDLTEVGDYHFFVAYYIANPTDEEKTLLDPNNWNTCIDLAPGLTDNDRTWSAQVIDLPLATRASMFAKAVIGKDYRTEPNNAFTKGWNNGRFVDSKEIEYLDCSGLAFWSYNKAYGAEEYQPYEVIDNKIVVFDNPVAFEGAENQYWYNCKKIGKEELRTGDLLFFNTKDKGDPDHVAVYVDGPFQYEYGQSEVFAYNTVEATVWGDGIITVASYNVATGTLITLQPSTGMTRPLAVRGYGRVEFPVSISVGLAEKMGLIVKSPVTLNVTDPRGFTITDDVFEVPGMIYLRFDTDGDGELDDAVVVLGQEVGDYFVQVIPKLGADPNATYTLELWANNETTIMAQEVPISDTPSQPYIVTSNETTVVPRLDPHDIGITQFITSKTVVGQNFLLLSSLSIFNYGNATEAFDVTVYANTTTIGTFANVTLASRSSTTLNISWNTTGFASGNYTISAYAWPVQGETYTADNTLVDGIACVVIPGDVNGDGTVNILDAIRLGNHFLETPSSPGWNQGGNNADINGDGVVNILDAIILGNHFLEHYP